jgi:integration host factor subunit beta
LNKLELIHELQIKTKLNKKEAAEVVNLFFETIADSLANGDRVEIRGLCSFYVKEYGSYIGRNPKTGKKVQIPSKSLPFFKCGKELRERVDKKHKKASIRK